MWREKIKRGMELIMEGCEENTSWRECNGCPFENVCDSVYRDPEIPYSTPDTWKEEGIFDRKEDGNA